MVLRSVRQFALLAVPCFFALFPVLLACPAQAAQLLHLHGLVLATDVAKAQAIVRHDAVGSMPGMTMSFAVAPAKAIRSLQAGETIDAGLDRSTDPWTLRDIHVVGAQSLTNLTPSNEQPNSAVRNVTALVEGSRVPNTPFIDERGKPFTFATLRGSDVVLAFIYTRCRDPRMCPLISAKFQRLQTLFRDTNTRLVEVSLDPSFDRPAVLARYAKTFGAEPNRWTLLTGDLDRTLDFAAQFDVSVLPDPRYGIIHSERTVLVDRDGAVRRMIDETSWTPEEIVDAVGSIEHQESNPLLRLNLWLSAQAVSLCGDRAAGFSGFADLLVALAVVAGFGWLLYRLGRSIFAASP